MFKHDYKTIVMSTKEKDKSTRDELIARGWNIVERNIVTADYQIYGLPGGLRAEKKQDVSELIKSFGGNVRGNSDLECWRAHADGTPIVYIVGERVTQSGAVIDDIWDLINIRRTDLRPENRHENVITAIEMMQEMKDLYDVHFVFVDHDKLTDTIDYYLYTQPWTIYAELGLDYRNFVGEIEYEIKTESLEDFLDSLEDEEKHNKIE